MSKHAKVTAILEKARKDIAAILNAKEDEAHLIRMDHALKTQSKYISLMGGIDLEGDKTVILGPATTIGGEKIVTPKTVQASELQPEKSQVDVLKAKVEEAYALFPGMTSDLILSQIEETAIRGVAKKVGMPYSKKEVKHLTKEYVEQIKANIQKLADEKATLIAALQAKYEAAQSEEEKAEYTKALEEAQK